MPLFPPRGRVLQNGSEEGGRSIRHALFREQHPNSLTREKMERTDHSIVRRLPSHLPVLGSLPYSVNASPHMGQNR